MWKRRNDLNHNKIDLVICSGDIFQSKIIKLKNKLHCRELHYCSQKNSVGKSVKMFLPGSSRYQVGNIEESKGMTFPISPKTFNLTDFFFIPQAWLIFLHDAYCAS